MSCVDTLGEFRFLVAKRDENDQKKVQFRFLQNVVYDAADRSADWNQRPIAFFQFKEGTEFPEFSGSQLADALTWAQRNCVQRRPFQVYQ